MSNKKQTAKEYLLSVSLKLEEHLQVVIDIIAEADKRIKDFSINEMIEASEDSEVEESSKRVYDMIKEISVSVD